MKWIRHDNGKRTGGDDAPLDTGNIYMVDEESSFAIVNGIAYEDGKMVKNKVKKIKFKDKEMDIDIDKDGKIKDKEKR